MKIGARFTHNYLELGAPIRDSPRIRKRLAANFQQIFDSGALRKGIASALERQLGVSVHAIHGLWLLDNFFLKCELRDLLDSVTEIHRCGLIAGTYTNCARWRKAVVSIFAEENAGYSVDNECGVHYAVDEHFEHSRSATIKAIGGTRYSGVLAAFEDAHRHLDGSPMDTKAAVRSGFEALEILVKLMIGGSRLDHSAIGALKGKVGQLHALDATAANVTNKLLRSLSEWVDAVHFYRHGQGAEEPIAPPVDLAIYLVSSAADHIRWLASVDNVARNA